MTSKESDRYLIPDYSFDYWCETVMESFSDDFYNANKEWIDEYDGQCDAWMNALYDRHKEPNDAAAIIERANLMCERYLTLTPPGS